MNVTDKFRQKNRNSFVGSAYAAANFIAAGATVFGAPMLWSLIDEPIWHALNRLYSEDMSIWLWWAFKLGLYPAVFFLLRMTLVTAVVSAAVVGAMRFV